MDKRMRIIVNFKNNELEEKMYKYVKGLLIESQSSYIKKLILKDMQEKGLL